MDNFLIGGPPDPPLNHPQDQSPKTAAISAAYMRGDFRLARALIKRGEKAETKEIHRLVKALTFDIAWAWVGLASMVLWALLAWLAIG